MTRALIGIIGGSGIYELEGIRDVKRVKIDTPFGDPSDDYVVGELHGKKVAFLARHGRKHTVLPHEINYRANIFGFKKLGVEYLLSPAAVGSLKEHIKPLDFLIADQFYDRTKVRISTFFGNGIAAHIPFSNPVCEKLSDSVYRICSENLSVDVHRGGTYVCMEGPQFSTRAESEVYRKSGFDVIGMTALQEAKLAREAEICFAGIALVTDYDCWHEEEVSIDQVLENVLKNTENAKELISRVVGALPEKRECPCSEALATGIITPPDAVPEQTARDLEPIIGKYMKGDDK